MEIQPYKNRLLVEPLEAETYKSGSLVIPDTVKNDIPPQQGKVVAVGNGPEIVTSLGATVVFGLGVGTPVKGGRLIIQQSDVICEVV